MPQVKYLTSLQKLKRLLPGRYTLALSSFRSTKPSVTSHHPFLPHINPASPPSLCSSVTAAPGAQKLFHLPGGLFTLISVQPASSHHPSLSSDSPPSMGLAWPSYLLLPPTQLFHVSTSVSSWYFLVSYDSLTYFPVYCWSPPLDYMPKGPSA